MIEFSLRDGPYDKWGEGRLSITPDSWHQGAFGAAEKRWMGAQISVLFSIVNHKYKKEVQRIGRRVWGPNHPLQEHKRSPESHIVD